MLILHETYDHWSVAVITGTVHASFFPTFDFFKYVAFCTGFNLLTPIFMLPCIIMDLPIFERVISGALKNGVIDEEEFNTLQTLHLETLNELMGVDHRMEAENRSLVEKNLMEEINELKQKQKLNCLLAVLFRMLL